MQPRPTVEPPEMSSSPESGGSGDRNISSRVGPREQKGPFEQEHNAVVGTAHPNILNLLSTDEAVKSRATAMVMTVPDVIVNPFWAKPPVSLAPTFKRPCSEATLAKLKRKFAKSASQTPLAEATAPAPAPPLQPSDLFQTSILKDILLGNRSKPEMPTPVKSAVVADNGHKVAPPPSAPSAVTVPLNGSAPKPTPVVTIDDDDDIRLISATSRATASPKEHKENRSQISNQNRSSVICKIPSSAKQSLSEVKNNSSKTISRIEQFSLPASEISGKHFIDSIFKNIMCPSKNRKTKEPEKSEKQSSTMQPPKLEAPQPLPKSDTFKAPPKPIILEPKASPSCASALCALLQTKSEPEIVIKPKRFESSHQSSSLVSDGFTNRVYQQMIEFEYNHEFIVKKFKQQESSSFSPSFSTQLELNSLEKSYQDKLSDCLSLLHSRCLFSIQFPELATSPASLPGPKTKTESLVNLLIHITSQLVTFSGLNTFDQMSLLSENIIELLLLRSLLIKPNCIFEQFGERESLTPNDEDNDLERKERNDDDDDDEEESELVIEEEEEEIRQFRDLYQRLTQSVDKSWCKDKTVFNLIFAILLFRTSKSQTILINKEKIREQHLSYVYLLKRHLEQKFRSFCTARSHFIRIFDHLEELHAAAERLLKLNTTRPEIPVLESFAFC
ncbi:Nuclear receptor [Tyrophagus putrescentiae]|nr:Nuclear receptor [Tyrophagus putrescentiae]